MKKFFAWFHKGVDVVAEDVKAALTSAKASVEATLATVSPEVKVAVEDAAKVIEQAILAALAAHGL